MLQIITMNTFYKIIFSLILLSFFQLEAQKSDADFTISKQVVAKIESSQMEGVLKINAVAVNPSPVFQSLNYSFLSVKKGKKGNLTSSKQGGKFSIEPQSSQKLSAVSLNIKESDGVKIYLFIRDEKSGTLISKDSLEINEEEFAGLVSDKKIDEDDLMLTNLTIDDTKTRMGKNFYETFYAYVMLSGAKFNFPIKVTEVPLRGRSTKVTIYANDKPIFSLPTKPDEEYIRKNAKTALARLVKFQQQSSVIDEGFIY